jgi:microcystin-dependent protein
VISFAGSWPEHKNRLQQQGWRLCDGSALPVRDHIELYVAIGTLYTKNPSSPLGHFCLPNYKSYVLPSASNDTLASGPTPLSGSTNKSEGTDLAGAENIHCGHIHISLLIKVN